MVRDFPPRTWVSTSLYQRCREWRLFSEKKSLHSNISWYKLSISLSWHTKWLVDVLGIGTYLTPFKQNELVPAEFWSCLLHVFSPFFFSQKWICRKLLWQIMECSLRDLHHDRGRNDDFECERFFSCMCPCIYVPHLPINSPWHAFRAYPVSYICHTFPGTVKT